MLAKSTIGQFEFHRGWLEMSPQGPAIAGPVRTLLVATEAPVQTAL